MIKKQSMHWLCDVFALSELAVVREGIELLPGCRERKSQPEQT